MVVTPDEFFDLFPLTEEQRADAFRDRARAEIAVWLGPTPVNASGAPSAPLDRAKAAVGSAQVDIERYLVAVNEIEYLNAYIFDILNSTWPQFVQDAVGGQARVRATANLRHLQEDRDGLEREALRLWDSLGSGGSDRR